MDASWILLDNFGPFLRFTAELVGYQLLPEEEQAIGYGVAESDVEADIWYEYEFQGQQLVKLRLAADPGSLVFHWRAECAPVASDKIGVAARIMQEYTLSRGHIC